MMLVYFLYLNHPIYFAQTHKYKTANNHTLKIDYVEQTLFFANFNTAVNFYFLNTTL